MYFKETAKPHTFSQYDMSSYHISCNLSTDTWVSNLNFLRTVNMVALLPENC